MGRVGLIFAEIELEMKQRRQPLSEVEVIVRLLDDCAHYALYVAINNENRRMLLISTQKPIDMNTLANLPRWNGVDIQQRKVNNPLYDRPEWFVVIEQQMLSDNAIYEALISDLYQNLKRTSIQGLMAKLHQTLEKWQEFFSKSDKHGLSREAQQGLFGELIVLIELINSGCDPVQLVNAWYGPDKETIDFQFPMVGLEVKTSSANPPYRITVANERQLDITLYPQLFLYCAMVEMQRSAGESVNDLVKKLQSILQYYPITMKEFTDKLLRYGYLEAQADLYDDVRFISLDRHLYRVSEDFPRIISSTVPPGIFNVKYQILLASCHPFEVRLEDVATVIKGSGHDF